LTENTRRLTPIVAHLSSAAIRLASIEEVLKDANVQNDSYRQCRDYFNGRDGDADDPRGSTPSEWLHVMLRDNAAHEEPPPILTVREDVGGELVRIVSKR
jgi:hypothetical protein